MHFDFRMLSVPVAYPARRPAIRITDLANVFCILIEPLHRAVVHSGRDQTVCEALPVRSQHNLIFLHIDPVDKDRFSQRKTQTLPLPDRVAGDPPVFPDDPAIRQDKMSFPRQIFRAVFPLQKCFIIPIRHKTDVLAVSLIGNCQSDRACDHTHLFLLVSPHRHKRMLQLLLSQIVQHIGLILALCLGPEYRIPALIRPAYTGIMPGRDIVCPQLLRLLQHRTPFQIAVARDTRVRCPAIPIRIAKIIHYGFPEQLLHLEYMERYRQHGTDPHRVLNR